MSGHSASLAPELLWPAVASAYRELTSTAHGRPARTTEPWRDPADPPFRHLHRLTDHIGLLEHAEGIVPRHEHGYCVDDVARGLVVVCREPSAAR